MTKVKVNDMARIWRWHTVRLALTGVPENAPSQAVPDLQDVLTGFPHLRNVLVTWDEGFHRIVVQLDLEDWEAKAVSKRAAEELLEVIPAVFVEAEGIHVEVLGTNASDKP